jgi:hypothetical protein
MKSTPEESQFKDMQQILFPFSKLLKILSCLLFGLHPVIAC